MIEVLPPEFSEENPAHHELREKAAARERRPIIVGLVGTVAFHLVALGLIWLMPHVPESFFMTGTGAAEEIGGEKELVLDLASDSAKLPDQRPKVELTQPQKAVLAPEEVTQPKTPVYIAVNPLAPANEPDHAVFDGAMNQQAAQPDPGTGNSPIGQVTPNSPFENYAALVSGDGIVAPVVAPPPGMNGRGDQVDQQEIQALVEGSQVVVKAQTPLPGFEKITGDNPDGIGTNIGNERNPSQDTDKTVAGEKSGTEQDLIAVGEMNQARMRAGASGRPGPRPRPRIQTARPAFLMDQPVKAIRLGVVGADTRLTEYGEWKEGFLDTISAYSDRHSEEIRVLPSSGSFVIIRYRMNSRGEITQIVDVKENAGKQWTYACLDALQAPSPYRPWPKDMIAAFGEESEFTFWFAFDY